MVPLCGRIVKTMIRVAFVDLLFRLYWQPQADKCFSKSTEATHLMTKRTQRQMHMQKKKKIEQIQRRRRPKTTNSVGKPKKGAADTYACAIVNANNSRNLAEDEYEYYADSM